MFVPCTDPSTVWEEYQAGLLWERVGTEYYPAVGWSEATMLWYVRRVQAEGPEHAIPATLRIYKCFED